MSIHQHNDGRWIVAYKDADGKRHDKSFGRGEQARLEAIQFDKQMRPQVNPEPVAVPEAPKLITFGELVKEYIHHSRSRGSTEKHLYDMALVVRKLFFPFIAREMPINEIDYGRHILPIMDAIATQPSKAGKPRSDKTLNQYGQYLSTIFNYAVERGYLPKNPMKLWKKRKIAKNERKLTLEDARKIMDCAAPHLQWAMEVCFTLGTRSGESELLSLTWDDVNFEEKMVHIYGRKTKTHRNIPVSDAFLERLRIMKAKARTNYVIEFKGRPIKKIRNSFRNAVRRAGITYPVRMYDLRHLFATTLLDSGASIGAVSQLMGHSKTSTTVNIYYHTPVEEIEKAVKNLPHLV